MRAKKRKIKFPNWIDFVGVKFISEALAVDPSTVRKWKKGGTPKRGNIKKIISLSNNLFTYQDFI